MGGLWQALKDAGWEITEVAPAPELPDSAFIEDTLVVYGDVAVVTPRARRSVGPR